MNIWEILGIEKTTDLNEIKKAYAHRAKQWHPEEYPEEFQRLQKAYKIARAYAKTGEINIPVEQEESQQEETKPGEMKPEVEQQQIIQESEPDYDYSGIEEEQRRWENQEQFWKTVSDMIRNPYKRKNTKLWKIYLNRTEVRALFHEQKFRYDFVASICQTDPAGWNRSPIQFLDKFLKQFESSSQEKVTKAEEWVSLKKMACSLKRSILKVVMKVIMTPLVWQVLIGIIVVSLLLFCGYLVQ